MSDGGNSITGGSIGDIIRFRGMNTYVGPNATCTSICAFIWLAGHAKFAANSAHIGFHGAYSMHTLQPFNEMNILLAVYLAQLSYNYDDVLWMPALALAGDHRVSRPSGLCSIERRLGLSAGAAHRGERCPKPVLGAIYCCR